MSAFQDPKLFINRELSWVAFNARVLGEARDKSLPVYERLKFLSIVSSNLDEFFMVRVAGLKQQIASSVVDLAADGLVPGEQLAGISDRVHTMVAEQARVWREEVSLALLEKDVHILPADALSPEQKTAARAHFASYVFPALTPLAVDPGHPFPHLRNKSLNLAVQLRRSEGKRRTKKEGTTSVFAVVQVPAVMSRLVSLPAERGLAFILLDELIAFCCADLFPGFVVEKTTAFRVTRNWDLAVDEEESEDLLSTIQDELRRRDRGAAVRLEIAGATPAAMEQVLATALKVGAADVYRIEGAPLVLSDLSELPLLDPRPELRVEPYVPTLPPVLRDVESIFPVIAERDVMLHHPFESFDPVVRFLSEAAEDPAVLAIKMTLYRTSGDSPFVRALSRAAENGKQVAVLVEIKARFDEANNIAWARRLEENGVHVVYGLIGLKTHCKAAMVVRREGGRIRRYVHLGTGNYNPKTAQEYTDLSFFTAREEMADDVGALFNMLTGFAEVPSWKRLAVAPFGLHGRILRLIEREAKRAQAGEPARIIAKMNALVDPEVIRALYAASQAGVEIDLLVRGICCLRPGIPGVSDKIRVTSIVDRFLEHARVYAFGAGDRAEVYLSSADWMPRNFRRRVEILAPIEDAALRTRLLEEVLGLALRDGVKAHRLDAEGSYGRAAGGDPALRFQSALMDLARGKHEAPVVAPVIRQAAAPAEITAAAS